MFSPRAPTGGGFSSNFVWISFISPAVTAQPDNNTMNISRIATSQSVEIEPESCHISLETSNQLLQMYHLPHYCEIATVSVCLWWVVLKYDWNERAWRHRRFCEKVEKSSTRSGWSCYTKSCLLPILWGHMHFNVLETNKKRRCHSEKKVVPLTRLFSNGQQGATQTRTLKAVVDFMLAMSSPFIQSLVGITGAEHYKLGWKY